MKNMFKFAVLVFVLIICASFKVSAQERIFYNKVESKILYKAALSSTDFIQYPSKSNVSIDKTWTIKFTSDVDMNKIDGI